MSSLWTPGGERPVGRDDQEAADDGPEMTDDQMEELAALQEELAKTPAATVVANHCFGLFELAALHLSLQPPQLAEASVAIDALAAIVEGLGNRLDEHEAHLKEGLAQLRLAFVQIRAANLAAADPPPDHPS